MHIKKVGISDSAEDRCKFILIFCTVRFCLYISFCQYLMLRFLIPAVGEHIEDGMLQESRVHVHLPRTQRCPKYGTSQV